MKRKNKLLVIFLVCSLTVFIGFFIVNRKKKAEYITHREKGEALLQQARSGVAFYFPLVREAEAEFKKALEMKEDDSDTHTDLGIVAGIYGHYEIAEKEFLRALEINFKNTFAWNNLAKAYWDQGKKDEAKDAWRRSLEIDSNQSKIRQLLQKAEG